MNEPARAPVAIRVTRPYVNEAEFLDAELETVAASGITLVGAQPRPEGVVLRFELVLRTGEPLVRGEGRVVGYRPHLFGEAGGLSLRFLRLDARSKAFVDRVAAMREARGIPATPTKPPGRPSHHPTVVPPPPSGKKTPVPGAPSRWPEAPPAPRLTTPRPPADREVSGVERRSAIDDGGARRSLDDDPTVKTEGDPMEAIEQAHGACADDVERTEVDPFVPSSTTLAALLPPPPPASEPSAAAPRRDELLARLRTRARALPAERVDAITRTKS